MNRTQLCLGVACIFIWALIFGMVLPAVINSNLNITIIVVLFLLIIIIAVGLIELIIKPTRRKK